MPIRPVTTAAPSARARLSSVTVPMSLVDFATALAKWQESRAAAPESDSGPMLLPASMQIDSLLNEPRLGLEGGGSGSRTDDDGFSPRDYVARAGAIRRAIARHIYGAEASAGMADREDMVDRIPFQMPTSGGLHKGPKLVWFLAPASLVVGVGHASGAWREALRDSAYAQTYIRLLLLKELAERGAIEASDAVVHPGFGSTVYFGPRGTTKGVLKLAEVDFSIREIGSTVQVMSQIRSKAFVKKRGPVSSGAPSGAVQLIDAGEGGVMPVARLNPAHFFEVDARRYHLTGITLNRDRFRQSRLYYLNVATEFVGSVLRQAAVPYEFDAFQATHIVEGGFVEPPAIAKIPRRIHLLEASLSSADAPVDFNHPLNEIVCDLARLLGPIQVAGRQTEFEVHSVRCPFIPSDPVGGLQPELMNEDVNFLVFARGGATGSYGADQASIAEREEPDSDGGDGSGAEDDDGDDDEGASVLVRKLTGSVEWSRTSVQNAYELLSRGDHEADVYTRLKYGLIHDRASVRHVLQGVNAQLLDLRKLGATASGVDGADDGGGADEDLRTKLRRCLVEISLKEVMIGAKPLDLASLDDVDILRDEPKFPLQLVATRRLVVGSGGRGSKQRQLVSVVDALLERDESGRVQLRVIGNRRSRWARSEIDAAVMAGEFPFLQSPKSGVIRDGQFWMVDGFGNRLAAWSGSFVPKVLLNDRYAGIEAALSAQDPTPQDMAGEKGPPKTYSKGAAFNLLPYYMSMLSNPQRGETPGRKIAVEDRGSFLRVFVPPAGSLDGPGKNPMSNIRDVMVYDRHGQAIENNLLELPLVRLYLHTMTAGILVAGGNSKMSLLEKLARLPIEN